MEAWPRWQLKVGINKSVSASECTLPNSSFGDDNQFSYYPMLVVHCAVILAAACAGNLYKDSEWRYAEFLVKTARTRERENEAE